MNKFFEKIEEEGFTTREFCLMGCILFLLGILMGIVSSPKGPKTIGCNNGCNCGNNNEGCLCQKEDEEEPSQQPA